VRTGARPGHSSLHPSFHPPPRNMTAVHVVCCAARRRAAGAMDTLTHEGLTPHLPAPLTRSPSAYALHRVPGEPRGRSFRRPRHVPSATLGLSVTAFAFPSDQETPWCRMCAGAGSVWGNARARARWHALSLSRRRKRPSKRAVRRAAPHRRRRRTFSISHSYRTRNGTRTRPRAVCKRKNVSARRRRTCLRVVSGMRARTC